MPGCPVCIVKLLLLIDVFQTKYNEKLCYRRRTAQRAMSVEILSPVETSPQHIAVMELEDYS